MDAIPNAVADSWTEPTEVLPLAERTIYRRQPERIFFSVLPPAADVVSIHDHQLEPGRLLVVEWVRTEDGEIEQAGEPINVPSIENAREYVPPGSTLVVDAPAGFAREVWRVR